MTKGIKPSFIFFAVALLAVLISCDGGSPKVYSVVFADETGATIYAEDVLEGKTVSPVQYTSAIDYKKHGKFLYWSDNRKDAYDFSKPIKSHVLLKPVFDNTRYSLEIDGDMKVFFARESVTLPIPEIPDGYTRFLHYQGSDGRIYESSFLMPEYALGLESVFE